jgi:hypothetical protein
VVRQAAVRLEVVLDIQPLLDALDLLVDPVLAVLLSAVRSIQPLAVVLAVAVAYRTQRLLEVPRLALTGKNCDTA